ncbi:MAG: J domain-containing protein [Endozoicomonadaceae bacterium]|nr:J domain-containing protein [Endozoicomonadaceae bacterium]MCY4329659.1 J domain-containing protein [Endozoicomonadaceae bacterium]
MKWKNIETGYKNQLEKIKAQNPYERLDIEYGATMDEVKKAYRKKMRLYHPDKTHCFLSKHGEAVSKLFNQAIEQIKREMQQ